MVTRRVESMVTATVSSGCSVIIVNWFGAIAVAAASTARSRSVSVVTMRVRVEPVRLRWSSRSWEQVRSRRA
jgi:hypothetical protein